jgi:hypothetical protein
MSRATVIRIVFNLVLVAIAASSAHAQGKPPGTVTFSAAATGFRQFSSDLEPLGTVSASNAALSASVTRQMVAAFAAGISARLSSEDWQFDSPAAFGGSPPWHQLQRSSVGVSLSLALSKTVLIGVSPSLEWALENDAESEDALTYGAVVSALKVLKPDLILGAGASVYRQFYSIKTSPFLIINWKLSEKLRIANALPAGPEGGAGIELRWTLTPDWELAGGGVLRSERYRLKAIGSAKGNIAETSSMPMFVRLSRKLGSDFKADLYAGMMAQGRLRTRDSDGHQIVSSSYGAAPAIAATISFKR